MQLAMILLLPVIFIGLEIYVLSAVWNAYGFINTLFALFLSAIFGAGLAKNQGRYLISRLQEATSLGQMPPDEALHGMLVFIGGLLFIVPGFISDFAGLLMVLPGTRHVLVRYVKWRFANKLQQGSFRIFSFRSGMSWGSTGNRHPTQHSSVESEDGFRDVSPRVIDVVPISSESHEKK